MEKIKDNEYRCAKCGGVFVKGQSDEDAQKEYEEKFGEYAVADKCVVCDDCWIEMQKKYPISKFKDDMHGQI